MTNAELTISANYIRALASLPDATDRIALFFKRLIAFAKQIERAAKAARCFRIALFFTEGDR